MGDGITNVAEVVEILLNANVKPDFEVNLEFPSWTEHAKEFWRNQRGFQIQS